MRQAFLIINLFCFESLITTLMVSYVKIINLRNLMRDLKLAVLTRLILEYGKKTSCARPCVRFITLVITTCLQKYRQIIIDLNPIGGTYGNAEAG